MSSEEIAALEEQLRAEPGSPYAGSWRQRLSLLLADADHAGAAFQEACRAFLLDSSGTGTSPQLSRTARRLGLVQALRDEFTGIVNSAPAASAVDELLGQMTADERLAVTLSLFQQDDAPSFVQLVGEQPMPVIGGVQLHPKALSWADNATTRKVVSFQRSLLQD